MLKRIMHPNQWPTLSLTLLLLCLSGKARASHDAGHSPHPPDDGKSMAPGEQGPTFHFIRHAFSMNNKVNLGPKALAYTALKEVFKELTGQLDRNKYPALNELVKGVVSENVGEAASRELLNLPTAEVTMFIENLINKYNPYFKKKKKKVPPSGWRRDPKLTHVGIQQAYLLGKNFGGKLMQTKKRIHVYTSPFKRTILTAVPLIKELRDYRRDETKGSENRVIVHKDLHERQGYFEKGLPKPSFEEETADSVLAFKTMFEKEPYNLNLRFDSSFDLGKQHQSWWKKGGKDSAVYNGGQEKGSPGERERFENVRDWIHGLTKSFNKDDVIVVFWHSGIGQCILANLIPTCRTCSKPVTHEDESCPHCKTSGDWKIENASFFNETAKDIFRHDNSGITTVESNIKYGGKITYTIGDGGINNRDHLKQNGRIPEQYEYARFRKHQRQLVKVVKPLMERLAPGLKFR